MSGVKVIDRGSARVLAKSKQQARKKLRIGVMGADAAQQHPKSTATVGEVAFYNEFGTQSVPSRSFLRDWADANLDRIARELAADVQRVIFAGEDERAALAKRGKQYVQQVQTRIGTSLPPPNKPATLAKKSGSTTLIDTGTLLNSINFEVAE